MPLARSAIAITVAGLGFAALAQQFGDPNRPAPNTEAPAPAAPSPAAPAPAAPPQASPPAAAQPQVDESALRYFASQGDTRRVDAEIARLRALYPNWTPPSDLSQLSAGPVVARDPLLDQLWTLYTQDRLAEVRAAIAERQASDPQWTPPQDLVTAMDTAEARRRLVNASDSGQWRTVLSVATDVPSLLTCANVDVLWRVAEAFAKTDQPNRTVDAYTYLLTNCPNPAERLGTLQKALTLLPEQRVTDLLRLERKGPGNPDDFSSIRDELARRRVERVSVDGKATASTEDLAVVARLAENPGDAGNALLLGWYNYHHGNPERAQAWFRTALDRNAGPKAAEGYALSLRTLNRLGEAENFAYEWRDRSADTMKAYLDIATALLSQDPPPRLEAAIVSRIVPVVSQQRFADGAQALGWYSYNTNQVATARGWFRTALGWRADDEPSAYGLALTSQRLNDRAGFNAVVTQWRGRSQRIADLAAGRSRGRTTAAPVPVVPQPAAVQSLEPVPPVSPRPASVAIRVEAETVDEPVPRRTVQARTGPGPGSRRACTMTRNPGNLSADAALALGWCLMEINRPLEAVAAFDQAVRNGSPRTREEAAYGKTLAYLRKDLTSQAAIAAAEAPQTAQRRSELQATILAQRAIAAYREGRYTETILTLGERARIVPEQNDLMLIKGWSYFKLGRYNDATLVFRSVQRTGYSEEASVGLNAVLEATGPYRQ
jgi:cellulose synthase operon protein C